MSYATKNTPLNPPAISEIRGKCKATVLRPLVTSNTLTFPSDVQVDRKGHVAVLDDVFGAPQIDVYAPPAAHSSKLTLLSTANLLDAAVPSGFALTADGHHLWTADTGAEQAQEYGYPGGGYATSTLNVVGRPEGVAVTPLESP